MELPDHSGGKHPPAVKNLGMFIDDGGGSSLVVDGSKNPPSILQAQFEGIEHPVVDLWPDRSVRTVTFRDVSR